VRMVVSGLSMNRHAVYVCVFGTEKHVKHVLEHILSSQTASVPHDLGLKGAAGGGVKLREHPPVPLFVVNHRTAQTLTQLCIQVMLCECCHPAANLMSETAAHSYFSARVPTNGVDQPISRRMYPPYIQPGRIPSSPNRQGPYARSRT
jgi:hypothetical protein